MSLELIKPQGIYSYSCYILLYLRPCKLITLWPSIFNVSAKKTRTQITYVVRLVKTLKTKLCIDVHV